MELSVRVVGQVTDFVPLPLVLLHGFTQTGESWAPVITELAGHFRLVVPDAPGHGRSSAVRADLWATAELLSSVVAGQVPGARDARASSANLAESSAFGAGTAFWAGYSMGGRMALHVALDHPEQVERLVLISTSAGIEDPAARLARRAADDALAARIEHQGVEMFLSDWLAQPLFATLPATHAGLAARLVNTPAGLASSLRLAGAGTQSPLWHRLAEIRDRALPVLLIAGELDTKYCDHAHRMAAAIGPSAQLLTVKGAGHACHLERPAEVAAAISRFCARPRRGRPSNGQTDSQ